MTAVKNKRVTPVAFALHAAANHCDDLAEIETRKGKIVAAAALKRAAKEIREMIAPDQR